MSQISAPRSLLDEVEAFLAREDVDLPPTAFGLKAVNDGKFVADLRKGRRVWPETAERARAFMREYLGDAQQTAPKRSHGAAA